MQQQDVLSLLIEILDVQDLLVCSMVSKVFLRAIDSSKTNALRYRPKFAWVYILLYCLSFRIQVSSLFNW